MGPVLWKTVPLSWPRAKVSQRRPFVRFRAQPRSPLVEFRRPSVAGCQPAGACVASGVNLQNSLCKRFHGEGRGSRPQMRQRFGGGPGSGSQTSPLLRGAPAVAGSSFVVVLLHLFEEPTSLLSLCGGRRQPAMRVICVMFTRSDLVNVKIIGISI